MIEVSTAKPHANITAESPNGCTLLKFLLITVHQVPFGIICEMMKSRETED